MPNIIVHYADGLRRDGHTLTLRETSEIYNALAERANAIKAALLPELPERVREALTQSLADCEKLADIFE
jgi:hypothetical protein